MVRHQFKLYGAALALAVGLFGGVAYADENTTSPENEDRAGQQGVRYDGQIAQILSNANQGEIAQARVALRRARFQAVKDFAQHMISAHGKAQMRQTALYRSLRIKTEKSKIGNLIDAHGSAVLNYLHKQPAASFDRAYMSFQVMQHRFLLQVLDRELIPHATNPALRAELVKMRADVVQHLVHARAIRAALAQVKPQSGGQVKPSHQGR